MSGLGDTEKLRVIQSEDEEIERMANLFPGLQRVLEEDRTRFVGRLCGNRSDLNAHWIERQAHLLQCRALEESLKKDVRDEA